MGAGLTCVKFAQADASIIQPNSSQRTRGESARLPCRLTVHIHPVITPCIRRWAAAWRSRCALLGGVWLLLCMASPVHALQPVVLQLKWNHAFQFAGYYAALHQGYYREAGLDVVLREGGPDVDPVRELVQGRAHFGVGTSSLLLSRQAGHPVVVLGVVFQHSPLVLIAQQRSPTQSVHSLANTRVMLEPHSEELLAYLQAEGRLAEGVTPVPHAAALEALRTGQVAAISGYSTYEPYFLRRDNVPHHIYSPRAVGIDFYGDNLFTTETMVGQNPDTVEAFRQASWRGWRYALEHPEAVMDWVQLHHAPGVDRGLMGFESEQMKDLIRADLVEVGYMNPGRWLHVADVYERQGMLPVPPQSALKDFLYAPPDTARPLLPAWTRGQVLGLAGLLLLVSVLAAVTEYVRRVNTRLRATMAELTLSEERHRLLADNATDVIWIMDHLGRFTYVSPSVQRLRGYTPQEVMQQTLEEALTPEFAATAREAFVRNFECLKKGLPLEGFRGELEQPCKDGGTVWSETTVSGMFNAQGDFVGFLGVSRDITERRRVQDKMAHMAQYDQLTLLPNRALLLDRLEQAMARWQREQGDHHSHVSHLAVLFVDLDNFKPVNDVHGHAAGDDLLRAVANRMGQCVRASDTVARVGGDEFVVLLPEVQGPDEATGVAEKIRLALEKPFEMVLGRQAVALHISSSVGVALFPDHAQGLDELMRAADQAMYLAKQGGRNCVRLAVPVSGGNGLVI